MKRYKEKVAISKPRTKTSGETKPINIFVSDFQAPELWENKCVLFKTPRLWFLLWQPYQTKTDPKMGRLS